MEKSTAKKRSIFLLNAVTTVILGLIVLWGIKVYFNLGDSLYTNDAQIEEYINPVNTRIPGYVKKVLFSEHQIIKKGDTLVIIDDSEYKIQLAQAQAAYLAALANRNVSESSVSTIENNLNVSDANIKAAQARLWNAEQNFHRYENLLKEGAVSQQQFDQASTEYQALQQAARALIQQKNTTYLSSGEAAKRISVNDAEIKRTAALVDMAELNLSYTVITAPYDGVTGRRNIQEGQLLQAGQNLLSFVRNNSKWVVANYKETQVAKLKIGQRVSLKIDGLNNQAVFGKITAISEATGSRYSAVPTDNSTGNFVKVQQRIPVKIEFTGKTAGILDSLRAGMNVEVRAIN
ncbi:HlyD family efflux transporter periplasmic adaptor subunit [Flavobacterium sp. LC2016-01]|nr:HlyD family efflux transporter periplasmic adaptor subunit [Flavobacterium sp. LC2016-01]